MNIFFRASGFTLLLVLVPMTVMYFPSAVYERLTKGDVDPA
jgi:hypothetical protein